MYLVTAPDLEAKLIERRQRQDFPRILERYEAMLKRLGNIDSSEEVVALALIAADV